MIQLLRSNSLATLDLHVFYFKVPYVHSERAGRLSTTLKGYIFPIMVELSVESLRSQQEKYNSRHRSGSSSASSEDSMVTQARVNLNAFSVQNGRAGQLSPRWEQSQSPTELVAHRACNSTEDEGQCKEQEPDSSSTKTTSRNARVLHKRKRPHDDKIPTRKSALKKLRLGGAMHGVVHTPEYTDSEMPKRPEFETSATFMKSKNDNDGVESGSLIRRSTLDLPIRTDKRVPTCDSMYDEDDLDARIHFYKQRLDELDTKIQTSEVRSDFGNEEKIYLKTKWETYKEKRRTLASQGSQSADEPVLQVLLFMWAQHHVALYMLDHQIHDFAMDVLMMIISRLKNELPIEDLNSVTESYTSDVLQRLQETKSTLGLPRKGYTMSTEALQSIIANIFGKLQESLTNVTEVCAGGSDRQSKMISGLRNFWLAILKFHQSGQFKDLQILNAQIPGSIHTSDESKRLDEYSLSISPRHIRTNRTIPLIKTYQAIGRVLGFDTEIGHWDGFFQSQDRIHRRVGLTYGSDTYSEI